MTHKIYISRNEISKQNIFTILYKASGFWKNKPTKYQFLPYNILYITVIMYKDEFIFIDVLYYIYDYTRWNLKTIMCANNFTSNTAVSTEATKTSPPLIPTHTRRGISIHLLSTQLSTSFFVKKNHRDKVHISTQAQENKE